MLPFKQYVTVPVHTLSLDEFTISFFSHPDVVKHVPASLEARTDERGESGLVDTPEAVELDGPSFHVRLAAPDGAERNDGEVDSPVNGRRKSADKGENSVRPKLGGGEQLELRIDKGGNYCEKKNLETSFSVGIFKLHRYTSHADIV